MNQNLRRRNLRARRGAGIIGGRNRRANLAGVFGPSLVAAGVRPPVRSAPGMNRRQNRTADRAGIPRRPRPTPSGRRSRAAGGPKTGGGRNTPQAPRIGALRRLGQRVANVGRRAIASIGGLRRGTRR